MAVNNAGYNSVTVAGTSIGLTVPTGAKGALIVVQNAPVCYRDDGTAPVAVAGSSTVLDVGDQLKFDSWTPPGNNWRQEMKAIRFIRTGGTSGILSCHYYD